MILLQTDIFSEAVCEYKVELVGKTVLKLLMTPLHLNILKFTRDCSSIVIEFTGLTSLIPGLLPMLFFALEARSELFPIR